MGSESTSKALVAQVRHSEWQPAVDLDSKVYLRTSRMRVLCCLIIWGAHSLAAPNAMVTRACHPFLPGRSLLAWDTWSESWVGSYCAAAYGVPAWVVGAKVTGHHHAFVSMQLRSPATSPTARTRPPVKTFTSFSAPKALCFPNLNSPCREAQCMVSLLIVGFGSCLFINWRIWEVPLLFSPGIIQVYRPPVLVAAKKAQISAWVLRSSAWDIHPHTRPSYLPPVCIHNYLSYFFLYHACSLTLHVGVVSWE